MLRSFEKKIEKFIAESIPDPIKLIFFYGIIFWLGFTIGNYGYENIDVVVSSICEIY
jgi:hypothetical protein